MPKRRVIRDQQARLDPATAWLYQPLEPATTPIPAVTPPPLGLDDPDPGTPLYDALWHVHGLAGRHALSPTGEVPMARHADFDGDGILDHLQSTGPLDAVDSSLPVGIPDTGDVIDLSAPDPTPEEITHPDHPDFVEPWTGE